VEVTKVRIKVDSEEVRIPELRKFIGKTVEMIITEAPSVSSDEEKRSVFLRPQAK